MKSHKFNIFLKIGIKSLPTTLHLCGIDIHKAENGVCKNWKNQANCMNCGPKQLELTTLQTNLPSSCIRDSKSWYFKTLSIFHYAMLFQKPLEFSLKNTFPQGSQSRTRGYTSLTSRMIYFSSSQYQYSVSSLPLLFCIYIYIYIYIYVCVCVCVCVYYNKYKSLS